MLESIVYLKDWGYDPITPFGPVVEPDLPGAFLTEDPRAAMEAGRFNKVPLITGIVENEGILLHSACTLTNFRLHSTFATKYPTDKSFLEL